jgi:hypothetical protein
MPAINEHAVLWRCRECGKWSHAKRDPITHKRWHHGEGKPKYAGWFVWCGPFDRWTASHDDPAPRAPILNLNVPVSRLEREAALGMDTSDVPF